MSKQDRINAPFVVRANAIFDMKGGSVMFECMSGEFAWCSRDNADRSDVELGDWCDLLVKPNQRPVAHGKKQAKYTTIAIVTIVEGDVFNEPLSSVGSHLTENGLDTALPITQRKVAAPVIPPRCIASEIEKLLMTYKCMSTTDIISRISGIQTNYSDHSEGQRKEYHSVFDTLIKLHQKGDLFCLKAYRAGSQGTASVCFYGRNMDDILKEIDPCYGKETKFSRLAKFGNVTKLSATP